MARPVRVGLREVAEAAGVSVATVSRVLARGPNVRPHVRVKVLLAAEAVGYEPNLVAQGLRLGASRSIGFAVRDISNPIVAEHALGAETVFRDHGYATLLTNSEGSSELDVENLRLLRQRRVDGFLASFSDETFVPLLEEFERLEAPVVIFDRELPKELSWSAVQNDYRPGVQAAIERFAALGHRTIGVVAPPLTLRFGRVLARDVAASVAQLAVKPVVIFDHGPLAPDHGFAATERLLDRDDPPTALLVANNRMLIGSMRSLQGRSLTVPRHISLALIDRVEVATLMGIPLDVVAFDAVEMGRAAARLLLELLDGAANRTVVLPTWFAEGASSAAPTR